MNRLQTEKDYWNKNALDPDVDIKYISDVPTEDCLKDLPKMTGRVLEIGCGVGRLMQDFWDGTDISENMIEIAKLRKPLCFFEVNDGRTLPYNDDDFDFVYCYLVFQHLKLDAIERYVLEAYRVLEDGGTFTAQWIMGKEDEPFSNHYTEEEIDDIYLGWSSYEIRQSKAYKGWTIVEAVK